MNPQAAQDPLAGLHDIHLPADVSWWPPAPGWWLLMALSLLLFALFLWWKKSKKTTPPSRSALLNAARKELAQLAGDWRADHIKHHKLIIELSALLRRVAINITDESVAGITGEAWLNWLDSRWAQQHFTGGEGRAFIEAPYHHNHDSDMDSLLLLVRNWIEAQQ